jgi:hypothetical protein
MTVTTSRADGNRDDLVVAAKENHLNLLDAFEFGLDAQAEVERRIAEGIKAKLAELAKTATTTD